MKDLKSLLAHIPKKPGVYLMYDFQGKLIYVGKSRLLRNRVRSYFSGKGRDPKTASLVKLIEDIQFIVTTNEIEALVLENNLIKRHKPRFNVMLKDSKTHPYLMISLAEPFPRLLKVRKVKFHDGNVYYGPFPDERGLKFIIELLSRTYRLCVCKNPVNPAKLLKKACLRFEMGLCLGPGSGKVTVEEYAEKVKAVREFLSCSKTPDLSFLENRMETLSREFRFEEAGEIRDTIQAIQTYFTSQKVEFVSPIDRDLWGVADSPDLIVVSLFFLRGGKLLGNRTIEVEREPGRSVEDMLGSLMTQFYESNLIPRIILCTRQPKPTDALKLYLGDRSGKTVRIGLPVKTELKRLLRMADENAREILTNLKSENLERVAEGVLDLETRLQLPRMPMRVECIDISHLQGVDSVASLVVAINGEPRKSEYRRYHLKTIENIDDPASIAEITRRRFQRLIQEGAPLPDLFIVDGGIAQVNAARREMDSLGVDRPVFGLAKREETLVPPNGEGIKLPITCRGMRLLVRLRNEAHRFANMFRGKVHAKRVMRSALLNLPGVGVKTMQKIISAFGSLEKAALTSAEEIVRRASIPAKVAELVFNSIRQREK